MIKVLVSCVNYNSYNDLADYLVSIDEASELAADSCKVTVVIADNSLEKRNLDFSQYRNFEIHLFEVENLGYIGSSQKSLELFGFEKVHDYDFVIVSNVDLQVRNSFFLELQKTDIQNVGWVVNQEFTPSKNRAENPMYYNRLSKLKLRLLKILYTFPILNYLYENKFYRKTKHEYSSGLEIYAGHGSMMIFTKAMIDKCFPFNFPLFLYGEEIFFAEKIRELALKVVFNPAIFVLNKAGVSTGKLLNRKKCQYLKQSIVMILENFYK